MTFHTVLILVFSSTLAALGQVMLKLGASNAQSPFDFINITVVGGLAAYVMSLLLWLTALSRLPLHIVYTFTMVTFVLVGLASVLVLGERPATATLVGWGVIALGVALVYSGT